MKKISTLYKKDPSDLSRVINEITEENSWVFECGIPTRKFDGTSSMIKDGILYKRYDAKKGKKAPEGAIPCQEPDEKSGHHPHWVMCDRNNPQDKYFFLAYDNQKDNLVDGTYELCGEKINGNKEHIVGYKLIKHGSEILDMRDFSYDNIKNVLELVDIEGIVFHDNPNMDGRMCKIRKKDFGIKR